MARKLRSEGYEYDFIFMDQDMEKTFFPKDRKTQMQGHDAVEAFRKIKFRNPIIMRTSSCGFNDMKKYAVVGASAVMPKQIPAKALKPLLKQTFDRTGERERRASEIGIFRLDNVGCTPSLKSQFGNSYKLDKENCEGTGVFHLCKPKASFSTKLKTRRLIRKRLNFHREQCTNDIPLRKEKFFFGKNQASFN